MAAATKLLAKSEVGVAVLNYDDATLLASGVTIANIGATSAITFWIVVSGITSFRTVIPGQTAVLTFALPLVVTINGLGLVVAGVTAYGIGVGVDTAALGG